MVLSLVSKAICPRGAGEGLGRSGSPAHEMLDAVHPGREMA